MVNKMPGIAYRPLGAQTQPRMLRHDIICLHTMVGYLTSTEAMFRQNGYGGTESHFGIGGIWGGDKAKNLDGVVYQWQDLDFSADANFQGNRRIISIETADNAPKLPEDIVAWTPKQCDAIIKLVAALCKKFDIPAVLVPDSKPSRRGIAYHRQGIDPWRVSGGEEWSTGRGKPCPTKRRIDQINSIIIPGVKNILAGKPVKAAAVQEDDMEPKDLLDYQVTLTAAAAKAMGAKTGGKVSLNHILQWGGAGQYRLLAELRASNAAQATQLKALTDAVTAIAANSPSSIKAAFEQGNAALVDQMSQFRVTVTLDDDADDVTP